LDQINEPNENVVHDEVSEMDEKYMAAQGSQCERWSGQSDEDQGDDPTNPTRRDAAK
jgi:hypothetical protein